MSTPTSTTGIPVRNSVLFQGGFAWCYEAVDMEDNEVYAMKVVPKYRLTKPQHRDKVLREIRIHEKLNHKHVVKLLSSFEDDQNIYITLEYCRLKVGILQDPSRGVEI